MMVEGSSVRIAGDDGWRLADDSHQRQVGLHGLPKWWLEFFI